MSRFCPRIKEQWFHNRRGVIRMCWVYCESKHVREDLRNTYASISDTNSSVFNYVGLSCISSLPVKSDEGQGVASRSWILTNELFTNVCSSSLVVIWFCQHHPKVKENTWICTHQFPTRILLVFDTVLNINSEIIEQCFSLFQVLTNVNVVRWFFNSVTITVLLNNMLMLL